MEAMMALGNLRQNISQHLREKKPQKLIFGDYIIESALGKGSYGEVYKALDQRNNRYVALKIVDKVMMDNRASSKYVQDVQRRLLKTEDQLMNKCKSENILRCYDTIEDKQYKIFVLEYCNGGSLEGLIIKRKAIGEDEAVRIMKQIMQGLAVLHMNCVIHRDLKPENIMINNGVFKIADLGLSKAIPTQMTIGNFTKCGTEITKAPQVKSGGYGIKADIWSIGVIFYAMICNDCCYNERYEKVKNEIEAGMGRFDFKTINGKRRSEEVKHFLRQVLTKDQRKRLTSQEVLAHPLFNKEVTRNSNFLVFEHQKEIQKLKEDCKAIDIHEGLQVVEEVNESFFVETLNEPTKESPNELAPQPHTQSKQVTEKPANQPALNSNPQSPPNTEKKSPPKKQFPVLKIFAGQIPKTRVLQDQLFQKLTQVNLECLKAEFILKEIIQIIEKYKLLPQDRNYLEMMYLFSFRCFMNVSSSRHRKDQIFLENPRAVESFNQQTKKLYQQVLQKYRFYSDKLVQIENKTAQIVGNFFSKIFTPAQRSARQMYFGDRFEKEFTCTEDEKYYINKGMQIEYTNVKYISKLINQLRNHEETESLRQRLKCYVQINEIPVKDVINEEFAQVVSKILNKSAPLQ